MGMKHILHKFPFKFMLLNYMLIDCMLRTFVISRGWEWGWRYQDSGCVRTCHEYEHKRKLNWQNMDEYTLLGMHYMVNQYFSLFASHECSCCDMMLVIFLTSLYSTSYTQGMQSSPCYLHEGNSLSVQVSCDQKVIGSQMMLAIDYFASSS